MKNKIALVTGGNSGIGLVTVTELVKLGATIILVARDRSKGQVALEQAKRDSGSANIHLMLADLSLQIDVRNLALEVQNRFPRLDVLVNNAALVPAVRQVTAEGMETQLAVNHLAPFLLTNLLLEHLKKSDQGRAVTVSSVAHGSGKANFADIQSEHEYDQRSAPTKGWQTYCNTKLFNILFSNELARRLEGTRVTSNALHPGVIGTNLWRTLPTPMRWIANLTMVKPARGARTSIYLSSSPEVKNVTGKYYFDNCNQVEPSDLAKDVGLQQDLWAISEKLTGLN
jgi:NAD(P)-dependent dehydrogenase (short-subunit alcohol dehydrogenase family)